MFWFYHDECAMYLLCGCAAVGTNDVYDFMMLLEHCELDGSVYWGFLFFAMEGFVSWADS